MKYINDYGTLIVEPKKEEAIALGVPVAYSDLSDDQKRAYEKIRAWLKDPDGQQVYTLGGYAGTGKTTVLSILASELTDWRVAFCAYTGKAANVLRQKLAQVGFNVASCSTIHSLMYQAECDKTGRVVAWRKLDADDFGYSLVVVDEASMVDEEILKDLCSYKVRILAVGDHGQLPPVKGSFNLMKSPDVRLETIHRQAAENPIIQLSCDIRKQGILAVNRYSVGSMASLLPEFVRLYGEDSDLESVILCYTNRTRGFLNATIRSSLKREGLLANNDLLICLRNTRFDSMSIFNGMRGQVKEWSPLDKPHWIWARVDFAEDGLQVKGHLCKEQLGAEKTFSSFKEVDDSVGSWQQLGLLFDYAYAITGHKSQGSQYANVGVLLERPGPVDTDTYIRWLYTVVTRSTDQLYLVRR